MHRVLLATFALLFTLFGAAPALAQESLSLGGVSLATSIFATNLQPGLYVGTAGAVAWPGSKDGSRSLPAILGGYELTVGWRFNRFMSAEVNYQDVKGLTGTAAGSHAQQVTGDGLLSLPLGKALSIYGKAGVGFMLPSRFGDSPSVFVAHAGGGVWYQLEPLIGLRVEVLDQWNGTTVDALRPTRETLINGEWMLHAGIVAQL